MLAMPAASYPEGERGFLAASTATLALYETNA